VLLTIGCGVPPATARFSCDPLCLDSSNERALSSPLLRRLGSSSPDLCRPRCSSCPEWLSPLISLLSPCSGPSKDVPLNNPLRLPVLPRCLDSSSDLSLPFSSSLPPVVPSSAVAWPPWCWLPDILYGRPNCPDVDLPGGVSSIERPRTCPLPSLLTSNDLSRPRSSSNALLLSPSTPCKRGAVRISISTKADHCVACTVQHGLPGGKSLHM
jgi:hypothetical protein